MEAKNRSTGVTAAAIVAFVGSSLTALMSLLVLFLLVVRRAMPLSSAGAAAPADLTAPLTLTALIYTSLTVWGISTGVGLLRLKAWARASILVFAGFLVLTAGAAVPVLFILSRMPELQHGPPEARAAGIAVVAFILGLAAAFGIWWLVLFSLKGVRAQFDETGVTGAYSEGPHTAQARAMMSHRPLSITLIALLYLMGAPGALFALFRPYPAILLGQVLEGNAAKLIYLAQGIIVVILGIGLLQLKPWARIFGICISAMHALSGVVMYFSPGSAEKMLIAMMRFTPPQAQRISIGLLRLVLPFGLLIGILFSLAILWILVANKAAFASNGAGASGKD